MTTRHPPPPTRYGAIQAKTAQVKMAQAKLTARPPAGVAGKPPTPPPGPPKPAGGYMIAPRGRGGTVQCAHAYDLHSDARALEHNKIRETQIIYINGRYIASANGKMETDLLYELAKDKLIQGRAVVKAADPAAAYEKASAKFVILEGVDQGGLALHAEQNLLRVVDHLLRSGTAIAEDIEVWGQKTPCSMCAKVLKAFSTSLQASHGYALVYDGKENYVLPATVPNQTAPNRVTNGKSYTKSASEAPPLKLDAWGGDGAYALFHAAYEQARPRTQEESEHLMAIAQQEARAREKQAKQQQQQQSAASSSQNAAHGSGLKHRRSVQVEVEKRPLLQKPQDKPVFRGKKKAQAKGFLYYLTCGCLR
jgi:hypothetical protein